MAATHFQATSVGRPESGFSTTHNHVPKPGYKVHVEHIVTKKRKLNTTDTHITQPEPGYTFLAVGHADLAERCKDISRKRGVDVRLVSAQNKNEAAHKISTHLHRIGYHFQSDVFDQACNQLGYRLHDGKLIRTSETSTAAGFDRVMARNGAEIEQRTRQSATADEEIRVKKAIKELFPKIPEDALHEIFQKAWQEGAETVGNAPLPLSRRVQLATVAHIRHKFTEYDRLLKILTWADARKIVEPRCLEKLVEWRGDNEDHGDEVEDIVRETIVIDDEDRRINVEDEGSSSDTSYEIFAKPTRHEDIAAESSDERHSVGGLMRFAQYASTLTHSNHRELTRDRWHEAQARVRGHQAPFVPGLAMQGQQAVQPEEHVHVESDAQGRLPRKILQDGLEYVRVSPDREVVEPVHQFTQPQYAAYGLGAPTNHLQRYGYNPFPQHHSQSVATPAQPPRAYFAAPSPLGNVHSERIIQSIERSQDAPNLGRDREHVNGQRAVTSSGLHHTMSTRPPVTVYGATMSPSPPRRKRRRYTEAEERDESEYEPPADIAEVARRNDPRGDPVTGKLVRYYGQSSSVSSDEEYDPAEPVITTRSVDRHEPLHGLQPVEEAVYQSREAIAHHDHVHPAPYSQHDATSTIQSPQYHQNPYVHRQHQHPQYAPPAATPSHQHYAARPPPLQYSYAAPLYQAYPHGAQYPPVYGHTPQ